MMGILLAWSSLGRNCASGVDVDSIQNPSPDRQRLRKSLLKQLRYKRAYLNVKSKTIRNRVLSHATPMTPVGRQNAESPARKPRQGYVLYWLCRSGTFRYVSWKIRNGVEWVKSGDAQVGRAGFDLVFVTYITIHDTDICVTNPASNTTNRTITNNSRRQQRDRGNTVEMQMNGYQNAQHDSQPSKSSFSIDWCIDMARLHQLHLPQLQMREWLNRLAPGRKQIRRLPGQRQPICLFHASIRFLPT